VFSVFPRVCFGLSWVFLVGFFFFFAGRVSASFGVFCRGFGRCGMNPLFSADGFPASLRTVPFPSFCFCLCCVRGASEKALFLIPPPFLLLTLGLPCPRHYRLSLPLPLFFLSSLFMVTVSLWEGWYKRDRTPFSRLGFFNGQPPLHQSNEARQ